MVANRQSYNISGCLAIAVRPPKASDKNRHEVKIPLPANGQNLFWWIVPTMQSEIIKIIFEINI